ncbi:hypothetical protein BsWGS_22851 [Bradybaena similaris]
MRRSRLEHNVTVVRLEGRPRETVWHGCWRGRPRETVWHGGLREDQERQFGLDVGGEDQERQFALDVGGEDQGRRCPMVWHGGWRERSRDKVLDSLARRLGEGGKKIKREDARQLARRLKGKIKREDARQFGIVAWRNICVRINWRNMR